jgi:hypothetical protein
MNTPKKVLFTIIKRDETEEIKVRNISDAKIDLSFERKEKPKVKPKEQIIPDEEKTKPIPIPQPPRNKIRNHKKITSIPKDVMKFTSGFKLF